MDEIDILVERHKHPWWKMTLGQAFEEHLRLESTLAAAKQRIAELEENQEIHKEQYSGLYSDYNKLRSKNGRLLAALKRMVGRCERFLEDAPISEAEQYDPNYVSPLTQAKAAIKQAEEE